MSGKQIIDVLLVQPMMKPKMIRMEDTLESMQHVVGGDIEEYMPFEDDVAIICNDEGKMMGLPLNRGICDENGKLQDIIAGNFFICYAPIESENFLSLPENLREKYEEKFKYPEMFFREDDGKIIAKKINIESRKFNAER